MQRQRKRARTVTYALIFQLVKSTCYLKFVLKNVTKTHLYITYFSTSLYGNTAAPRVLTVDIFLFFFFNSLSCFDRSVSVKEDPICPRSVHGLKK
jgi:hypothetical protein